MKPVLKINQNDYANAGITLGKKELLNALIDSDLFEMGSHDVKLKGLKSERGSVVFFNDKKILIDFWEYPTPTYQVQTVEANFDLIIKLQHTNQPPSYFEEKCHTKQVLLNFSESERKAFFQKIFPWTFFPSRLMGQYVNRIEEIPSLEIKQFGFFCGKNWKGRHSIKAVLEKQGIVYLDSDQGFGGKPLDDEGYVNQMASSKVGIVLGGRASHFTEGKNRREIDYMMMKKPLLMNYRPYYYNPLIEGKNYVFLSLGTNIAEIDKQYDWVEMGKANYQWYLDNATPNAAAKVFMQIMKERL